MKGSEFNACRDGKKETQQALLDLTEGFARCKLSEVIDLLTLATWHRKGILKCKDYKSTKIPFIGRHYIKIYLEEFASDLITPNSEFASEDTDAYTLNDNRYINFIVRYSVDEGWIYLSTIVTEDFGGNERAEDNLVRHAKAEALREVLGLTKSHVIQKYNGRFAGGAYADRAIEMDRWCEPDGALLYHGFCFFPVFDNAGEIIDLETFQRPSLSQN